MEIRTDVLGGTGRVPQKESLVKRVGQEPRAEIAFENAEALKVALKRTPDIRAEAVELGRKLIQQPGYPSPQILGQLSAFLASHPGLEK